MSKSAAKAAISGALETVIRIGKSSADDIASIMLKNSDDVLQVSIRQADQATLARGVVDAFGANVSSEVVENLAKNSDDISTIAKEGVDELPKLSTKMTTPESRQLFDSAEELAKKGELGSKNVDEGKKLGEEVTKQQGGLKNWISNNPKFMVVGLTVTGLALYIGINKAVNGKSPAESLNDITRFTSSALTEVASLLGGLAASFAKGLLPLFAPLLRILLIAGGVIGAVILLGVILKVIKNRNRNKQS